MSVRQSRFGTPLSPKASESTWMTVEPVAGLVGNRSPTEIPPGATPTSLIGHPLMTASQNFVGIDGALVPRPKLSQHTASSNPMGVMVTGGAQIVSSAGSFYNLVSGTSRLAWYSAGSYSPLSQVSAGGVAFVAWSATTHDRTDFTQSYEPVNDEMLAIVSTTSSYNTLMTWKAGATVFSHLSQSPRARWVAAYDNFVLAGNVRDSAGSKYVQRIQWSDRGNPFNWTTGLSGFQDLLDAKGQIQRIMVQEQRIVLFFDNEVWVGQRGTFPNTFEFAPLDRNVGTVYGKTCVTTHVGIVFLGADLNLYLLPKDGGGAQPIGQNVRAFLKHYTVGRPLTTAWALYGRETGRSAWIQGSQGHYQLFFSFIGGEVTNLPNAALFLDLENGSYFLQSFNYYSPQENPSKPNHALTAGWTGWRQVTSPGQSWSDLSGTYTWATVPGDWDTYRSQAGEPWLNVFVGSSTGSIWYFNSNTTLDDGRPVECRWNSPQLFGQNPESAKCISGFRVDYTAEVPSTLSYRFSVGSGSGVVYTSAQSLALGVAPGGVQGVAVGSPYVSSQYPSFQVSSQDHYFRLRRFWVAARLGGRSLV